MREKADTDLGWFKVSDDLGQALARADLSPNEFSVCLWVMCKTYGIRKRVDGKYIARKFSEYSCYQIAKETGRDISGISRSIKTLLNPDRGILRLSDRGEIGFNTRLGTWAKGLVRGQGWGSDDGRQASTVDGRLPLTGVHQMVDGRPLNGGQASTPARTRARVEGEIESTPLPLNEGGRGSGLENSFTALWTLYPEHRRGGRPRAFNIWKRMNPSIELAATILAAVKAHKGSAKWNENGGQYVPRLDRWLRNERWTDKAIGVNAPDASSKPKCKACAWRVAVKGAPVCDQCSWCLECDRAGRTSERKPHDIVVKNGTQLCRECAVGEKQ